MRHRTKCRIDLTFLLRRSTVPFVACPILYNINNKNIYSPQGLEVNKVNENLLRIFEKKSCAGRPSSENLKGIDHTILHHRPSGLSYLEFILIPVSFFVSHKFADALRTLLIRISAFMPKKLIGEAVLERNTKARKLVQYKLQKEWLLSKINPKRIGGPGGQVQGKKSFNRHLIWRAHFLLTIANASWINPNATLFLKTVLKISETHEAEVREIFYIRESVRFRKSESYFINPFCNRSTRNW